MKKISTLICLIFIAMSAVADGINIKSNTVNPGGEVQTITVSLSGSNKYYTLVQMEIGIPEGYSFVQTGKKTKVYASKISTSSLFYDEGETSDHSVGSSLVNGKLRVMVSSSTSTEFFDYSGDLFNFYIKANSWVKANAPVEITISGVKLVPVEGKSTVPADQAIKDKVTSTTDCTLSLPAGWSTCVFPFTPASLPAGVKVYDVKSVGAETVVVSDAKSIGDYKPYIVKADAETTLTGTITAAYPEGVVSNGELSGVVSAKEITSGYVMQTKSETGFYKVGSAITVPMGKCYLTNSASAKSEVLYFELPTAIKNVEAATEDESVYNLNGVKVATAHRGIYIKGGKKVVLK